MKRRTKGLGLAAAAVIGCMSGQASALAKRVQVVQQGDFALIGNTLAHDCKAGNPSPVVGSVTCTMPGNSDNDPSPDLFWRAENGAAIANSSIAPDQAQTAARLELPPGATVTHAFLYWSARSFNQPDTTATLQCANGAAITATAVSSFAGFKLYHAAADVTAYVAGNGSCDYVVGGIDMFDFRSGAVLTDGYAAWWMVVLYKKDGDPHRHLTIFDGLDDIGNSGNSEVVIDTLLIPNNFLTFSKAKAGVIAYDGDSAANFDKLLIGDLAMPQALTALKDCTGDDQNFFNSTRCFFGNPVSVVGDLPQLSGQASSMDRLDLDVVDISNYVQAKQTSIGLRAESVEPVYLAGIVTSVPTFTDADMDGLSDDEEALYGTDPSDRDSDNDGVIDGQEGCSNLANCPSPLWNVDSDGDWLINALDPDSDNDGIFDGTELGLSCAGPDTSAPPGSAVHCIPDADNKTTTDPLDGDTDDGGKSDGSEDANHDGKLEMGETDPTTGHDADDALALDADSDGLSDAEELGLGSDPNDADTDDDGALDGLEANPSDDTDSDGLVNVLDVDSDNDGILDGTEAGYDCSSPDTNVSLGHCLPDADPGTATSPVDADTDDGGASDGAEDSNLNGQLDAGELDPTSGHGADDATVNDSDGDGLSDDLEVTLGSNPNDWDTDDDGVLDGLEANPSDDTDGDGMNNVNDPDSDGDGLFDGTEIGSDCSNAATNKAAMHCIPDGDKGKTTTSMVDKDSDNGGVSDGDEDFDKDGVYDANQGETNPNEPSDDANICLCAHDSDCPGTPNDGLVCDEMSCGLCVPGCRNAPDSGCPAGKTCTSTDDSIGQCVPIDGGGRPGDTIEYDGCVCAAGPRGDSRSALTLLLAGCAAAIVRRRRRPRA